MPKLLQGNAKLTPIRGANSVPSSVPVIIDADKKQVRGLFHCTFEGCDKKFPTRGRLRQHQFVHLPPNKRVKYACKLGCGLTFSNSSSRSRHHKQYCPNRPKQDTEKEKAEEQNDVAVGEDNEKSNDDIDKQQLEEKEELEEEEEEYDGGGWDGDDGRVTVALQNQPSNRDEQLTPLIENAFIPHSTLQMHMNTALSSEFACDRCKSLLPSLDMLAYCKQCEKEFCKPCFDIHATGHTLIIGRPLHKQIIPERNEITSPSRKQPHTIFTLQDINPLKRKATLADPHHIENRIDSENPEDVDVDDVTDVSKWFDKHLPKQSRASLPPTLLQEYTERIDTGAAIRIERRLKHQEDLLRGDPAAIRRERQRKRWQFLPPGLSINLNSEPTSDVPVIPPSSSPPISFASPPSPDALIDTGYVCNPKEIIQALTGNTLKE